MDYASNELGEKAIKTLGVFGEHARVQFVGKVERPAKVHAGNVVLGVEGFAEQVVHAKEAVRLEQDVVGASEWRLWRWRFGRTAWWTWTTSWRRTSGTW